MNTNDAKTLNEFMNLIASGKLDIETLAILKRQTDRAYHGAQSARTGWSPNGKRGLFRRFAYVNA